MLSSVLKNNLVICIKPFFKEVKTLQAVKVFRYVESKYKHPTNSNPPKFPSCIAY